MGKVEGKIAAIGSRLPEYRGVRAGAVDRAKRVGNLVLVSGHGPDNGYGEMAFKGKVGKDLTVEQGYEAARLCALSCLGSVKTVIDSLDEVEIVSVRGFVNCVQDFSDHAKVLNGASDLLLKAFGKLGRHVRTAVGASSLPGNIAVEVQMVVMVIAE